MRIIQFIELCMYVVEKPPHKSAPMGKACVCCAVQVDSLCTFQLPHLIPAGQPPPDTLPYQPGLVPQNLGFMIIIQMTSFKNRSFFFFTTLAQCAWWLQNTISGAIRLVVAENHGWVAPKVTVSSSSHPTVLMSCGVASVTLSRSAICHHGWVLVVISPLTFTDCPTLPVNMIPAHGATLCTTELCSQASKQPMLAPGIVKLIPGSTELLRAHCCSLHSHPLCSLTHKVEQRKLHRTLLHFYVGDAFVYLTVIQPLFSQDLLYGRQKH